MIENLVRPNIKKLVPYASARQEFIGKKEIFLDANENPYGSYNRYPDPIQNELKTCLAKMNQVKTENIFVGNGSDEVIDLAIRIFCTPKEDKILTFYPSYGMYKVSGAINDTEVIELKLLENFQIDFKTLKKVLFKEKPKIIFICSPNNPTGNIVHKIVDILKFFEGIVFIDEAYIDFSDSKSYALDVYQYRNLIVSKTLSKFHGMAGLRIGYCLADQEIISYFNKIKPPYNISQANQEKALENLKDVQVHHENKMSIIRERHRLERELTALDLVLKVYPSVSNFILVKIKNANEVYNKLIQSNIIVRNRSHEVGDCIRITIGNKIENDFLLESLKNIHI